jgi:hypothetical protein
VSGETEQSVSGWTVDTFKAYTDSLRQADARIESERDRRYTEVAAEREKALKIKETADLAALELAREIQTYKDEKANQLREQINSERGLYATKGDLTAMAEKIDATIRPLIEYRSTQQGERRSTDAQTADGRAEKNTTIAAAALATQIRGLYVMFGVGMFGGGAALIAALATHGFK